MFHCAVVDVGSHSIKAGWVDKSECLQFPVHPLTSPYEDGHDIPFRGDRLEVCVNEALQRLGATQEAPEAMVLTEQFCAPVASRRLLLELCFECYRVQRGLVAVDGLLSRPGRVATSLVVRLGAFSSHILPIVNNCIDKAHASRLNVGGEHASALLGATLSLAYPQHRSIFSNQPDIIESIKKTIGRVASPSYDAALLYADSNPESFQLPFTVPQQPAPSDLISVLQKRQQNAARMRAMIAQKRGDASGALTLEVPSPGSLSNEPEAKESTSVESSLTAQLRRVEHAVAYASSQQDAIRLLRTFEADLEHQLLAQIRTDSGKPAPQRNLDRLRLLSMHSESVQDDADFGTRESDWNVYQQMSLDSNTIRQHTPTANQLLQDHLRWTRKEIHSRLEPEEWRKMHAAQHTLQVYGAQYQMAETLFQPTALLGIEQAGLSELIYNVLKSYEKPTQMDLLQNIFLTGGNSKWKNLRSRIEVDLQKCFEPGCSTYISQTNDSELDTLNAAKHVVKEQDCLIGSHVYDEFGFDRTIEFMRKKAFSYVN